MCDDTGIRRALHGLQTSAKRQAVKKTTQHSLNGRSAVKHLRH